MFRPIEIEMIRADVAQFTDRKIKAGQFERVFDTGHALLKTKTANEWMKQEYGKPAPAPLFGNFWCHSELCILFADTNMGKSILAVQIADSITGDYCIGPFANKAPAGTRVLYFDFEQGAKQFETRYVHPRHGSHIFADSFYRAELDPAALADTIYYKNYNDYVQKEMTAAIKSTRAEVVIIDNITYMCSTTQHTSHALNLMKTLKELKTLHNLSILVLAHTPKRHHQRPLTVNDLQGSKMLINFADSAFAIGQSSTAPGTRYLKQIKQRSQQQVYGADNVCLISLQNELNFLQYRFDGYARELDHLQPTPDTDREQLKQDVLALHQKGHALRKIARELGVHHSTVGRIVREGGGNE